VKTTLTLVTIIFLRVNISVAQDSIAAKQSDSSKSHSHAKKYALGIGVFGYPSLDVTEWGGYGGSLKLDYLINSKLGLGIKAIGAFSPPPRGGTDLYQSSYSYTPKSHIWANLTATYNILGDYQLSSAALYMELGAGYGYNSYSESWYSPGNALISYTKTWTNSSFNGHFTLGGSYHLWKGEIFLEAIFGIPVYGTEKQNFSNVVYATGSSPPYLSNNNNTSNTGWWLGDKIIGLNLGYCF